MDTMLRDRQRGAGICVGIPTRRDTGNGNPPDIESRIQKAANRYEETVQKALPADNAETERRGAAEILPDHLRLGCPVPGTRPLPPPTSDWKTGQPRPYREWRPSLGEARDTEF